MTRVKTGPTKRARHNKVLNRTKGFRMTRNRLYKVAHEAYMHALQYAFEGRRKKKGDFRSLWITRINAGLDQAGSSLSYSRLIDAMKKANVALNRKTLSELAINDPAAFKKVVETLDK